MTGRNGWVPDRLWLRVPIKVEDLPGADEWLRRQVTHIATESGGRLLIGPPQRKEDPQGFIYDTVLYVYPAERPDPCYRAAMECGHPSPTGAMKCERETGHPYLPPYEYHQGHAVDGSRRSWRDSWD